MRDIVKSALAKALCSQEPVPPGDRTPGADAAALPWRELVCGERRCNLQFIAGKILLRHLERAVRENPSPGHVAACARELCALYANNRNMPAARNDLAALLEAADRSSPGG